MATVGVGGSDKNTGSLKKNRIQVSNTKKPIFFYINLAKKYLNEHNEVELSGLENAISTVVTISEILKRDGLAIEKKISTSTVDSKDESKGKLIQKAKIEIVLGKTENFNTLPGNLASTAAVDDEGKHPEYHVGEHQGDNEVDHEVDHQGDGEGHENDDNDYKEADDREEGEENDEEEDEEDDDEYFCKQCLDRPNLPLTVCWMCMEDFRVLKRDEKQMRGKKRTLRKEESELRRRRRIWCNKVYGHETQNSPSPVNTPSPILSEDETRRAEEQEPIRLREEYHIMRRYGRIFQPRI